MSTQAVKPKPRSVNPFTPASTAVNTTSASQSARPVTIPHLPELYIPLEQALDALLPRTVPPAPPATDTPAPPRPFIDALRATANRTTTWNSAPAYKSTLSPALDAFASLSQATARTDIARLLAASWAADPACTLRIVWNLRSIHEGKGAREQFYRAFAWLYAHHPRTAVANLRVLVEPTIKRTIRRKAPAEGEDDDGAVLVSADPEKEEPSIEEVEVRMPHGYWKDLLNILLLATVDQLHPTSDLSALHVRVPRKEGRRRSAKSKSKTPPTPGGKEAARARDEQVSEQAKVSRLDKHRAWHAALEAKLAADKAYRALYITVARLFADGLARDLAILREIADEATPAAARVARAFDLTLVGKWAPSIGGAHDRVTLIATPIAALLAPGGHLRLAAPAAAPLTQDAAHRLRSAYARWATAPLRRVLHVPEVAMSARRWGAVDYARVPSHSMRAHKTLFAKHDGARFAAYLLRVVLGKASISGATLLPHELVEEVVALAGRRNAAVDIQVAEAQWRALVGRVREAGALPNALAVCDVSGSMGYLGGGAGGDDPIAPAIALSILLAQVARPPWNDAFITFSATPELVALEPPEAGLAKIAGALAGHSGWGTNTDFNAVFTKLILPTAVEHKLAPEDMVQRLFVFTDMQFDESCGKAGGAWATEHEKIREAFTAAGYEMPEIVYWNLAGAVAKPVTKDTEGVALVSGFSPGMLKVFLEQGSVEVAEDEVMVEAEKEGEDGEEEEKGEKNRLDPIDTMLRALGKESFAGLEVFD